MRYAKKVACRKRNNSNTEKVCKVCKVRKVRNINAKVKLNILLANICVFDR
jgi:hypothetical protein